MNNERDRAGYPQLWEGLPPDEVHPELDRWFRAEAASLPHRLFVALCTLENENPKTAEFSEREIQYLSYALLHWLASRDQVPPATLMHVLHRLLKLDQCPAPPDAISRRLGMPPVQATPCWEQAASLDGYEQPPSERMLAKTVGVDRTTINRWRGMQYYKEVVETYRIIRVTLDRLTNPDRYPFGRVRRITEQGHPRRLRQLHIRPKGDADDF